MPLTRRQWMAQTLSGGLAATVAGRAQLSQTSSSKPPNFVFILTDDQRWDSLSATGHPFARTPSLDRLVHEGARFSNAFVTTSLCSPSRGSFLTGQYAHTHGVRDNFGDIRETAPTVATLLKGAGYDTAFFGKWHMGYDRDSPRPGFNRWISFKGQGRYFDPELNIDGERRTVEGYVTDLLSDFSADWIRRKREAPFFAYLSHKAVHTPIQPAPRHKQLYAGANYPLPASAADNYEGKPAWQKERRHSRTGIEGGAARYGSLEELVRRTYRCVASIDDGVGKILDILEETGKLDDTVVVFAGDNGFFHGEHGFVNKRAMYEESIRIPFFVRYPKLVEPGTTVSAMTLNIDLAPSILDLAGVNPPKGAAMQGTSWKPSLGGSNGRTSWLYEYLYEPRFAPTPSMQGVRTERWKYVRYPNIDDVDELYDLKNDPTEIHNLFADRAARSTLQSMRNELYRLLKATQAA